MGLRRTVFGGNFVTEVGNNLFIGGLSNSITDSDQLANKLGINVSKIDSFEIVEGEIQATINSEYTLSDVAFTNDLDVIYFKDTQYCQAFYTRSFTGAENLEDIHTKNAVDMYSGTAFVRNYSLKKIFVPNVLTFGNSSGGNGIFNSNGLEVSAGIEIFISPILLTNNSGNKDGDLQSAENFYNAKLYEVIGFEAPVKPTINTIDTIFRKGIKLIESNSIYEFDVYLNGSFYQKTKQGGFIENLNENTAYNIELVAIGNNLVESQKSEIIPVNTSNQAVFPQHDLFVYHKPFLDNGVFKDELNNHDGINSGTSVVPGKITNAFSFNRTNEVSLGMPELNNDCTIDFWINLNDLNVRQCAIQYDFYNTWGTLSIWQNGNPRFIFGDTSGYVTASGSAPLTIGNWHHILLTRDYIKRVVHLYLDGILIGQRSFTANAPTQPNSDFVIGAGYSGDINGKISEFGIWQRVLNEVEIFERYNNGIGITYN